jgi:hypothetical protein
VIVARPATPGLWCDFSTFPSRQQAAKLKAAGFVGCFCCLPLPGVTDAQKANDITAERLVMLVEDLNFEVGFYQHVRFGPWDPRNHPGAVDGAAAAEHAVWAQIPQGVQPFVDWEDLVEGLPVGAAKAFLEAWAATVRDAGYRAGMYCGFDDPLSPMDRYNLHGITSYWSDAGHRAVAVRGCAVTQGAELDIGGVRIDNDTVQPDHMNETPLVAVRAASSVA